MTTPTPPSDRHRRLTCATGIDLERAQADGLVTTHDADEVRRFGDYLRAAGPVESGAAGTGPRWIAALREHYPDDPILTQLDATTRPTDDPDAATARGESNTEE